MLSPLLPAGANGVCDRHATTADANPLAEPLDSCRGNCIIRIERKQRPGILTPADDTACRTVPGGTARKAATREHMV